MNENLNLVEILKDCPKGTKFYSRFLGSVEFCKITLDNYIEVIGRNGYYIRFKPNGIYEHSEETAEIDLFPSKDQRDWGKWHRPFVDGDIVTYDDQMAIFKKYINIDDDLAECYVFFDSDLEMDIDGNYYVKDLATEEEKAKLFKALKDKGYKWDSETKTLEKLIVPKFKVGDVIRSKNGLQAYKITNVTPEYYSTKVPEHAIAGLLPVKDQDDWILIPNKFDPKTLQPFDKVVVKASDDSKWCADFYSHFYEVNGYHICVGGGYDYCIPYNDDTKHLIGKTDEAPEFYRFWEE